MHTYIHTYIHKCIHTYIQASAPSQLGGAKRFLEDLIGVKEHYAIEAQRAMHEAELAKKRQATLAEQNDLQQALIRCVYGILYICTYINVHNA
jgi:hypothetical protein